MDKAHKDTDEMIEDLEERISKIYVDSNLHIHEEWDKYMEESKKRGDKLKTAWDLAIAYGTEEEIEDAEKEYKAWLNTTTLQSDRFRKMAKETAARITEANKIAIGYVNNELPECYALNYNFMAEQTKENANDFVFTIYDEQTIKNIIENPTLLNLPYREIDEEVDERWNVEKINSEVMQSIIAGDRIDNLASRLEKVIGMNEVSAMRSARTLMTATENQARQTEMEDAVSQGIIVEKEWVSIVDSRTRDWHLPSSFKKIRIPIDESFENGLGDIRYPGDMTADGANVYNCRCTIIQKYVKRAEKPHAEAESVQETEEMTFVPAKTKEEALEYAKKFAKDVDFGSLPLEDINEVNRALTNIYDKYDLNALKKIGKTRMKALMAASYKDLLINASELKGMESTHERFLRNNEEYKKEIERLKKKYGDNPPKKVANYIKKAEERIKYSRFGIEEIYKNKVEICVYHEMGHTISDQYFGMINKSGANPRYYFDPKFNEMNKMVKDAYKMAKKTGDIYNLSYYGSTDAYEFFAESFAAREIGEKIPDYVESMFKEVLENGIL